MQTKSKQEQVTDKKFFEDMGYFDLKEIKGRGMCGLFRFIFTTGLCHNISEPSYEGRFCFERTADAKESISEWDGIGDPHGDWIKHKGRMEYSNPNSLNK